MCIRDSGYPNGPDPLEDCSYVMFQFSPAPRAAAGLAAAAAALIAAAASMSRATFV